MPLLRNQLAVISGASSGVGRAIALELAAQGATLCLIGRQLATLHAVAEQVRVSTPDVHCYQADLTVDADIQRLKTNLEQDFGSLDVLVHSAGVITLGSITEAHVDDFDWQYRVNVRAPYALTQAVLPMLRARRGQVVFINSSVGLKARADVAQYAATKHALRAVADALRDEVNGAGIRVLTVYLGRTATPMQAAIHALEGKPYQPDQLLRPQDVAAVVTHALGLARTAEVTEICLRPLRKPRPG